MHEAPPCLIRRTKLDVRLDGQTFWLSQKQFTQLYDRAKGRIPEFQPTHTTIPLVHKSVKSQTLPPHRELVKPAKFTDNSLGTSPTS